MPDMVRRGGTWAALAVVLLLAGPAAAYEEIAVVGGGAVTGTVRFTGTPPPLKSFELWRSPDRTYCGALSDGSGYRLLREVTVGQNDGLKDVVVTIEGITRGKRFELKTTKLDANVCQFLPFVSVVRDTHPLTVFNLDPVSHDLQVYERDDRSVFIMFHRPSLTQTGTTDRIAFTGGRRAMTMQCGMHPFMQAHGLGVQNPYYAVTGLDGAFRITDLPPGTYRLRAWHPSLGTQEREVTVTADGMADVGFTFTSSTYRQ